MSFLIQKATKNDVKMLQNLAIQTFREAYAAQNTEAQMQAYIRKNFSTASILSELQNTASVFYLLFENDKNTTDEITIYNTAIAYLKLNFAAAQTEIHDSSSLEIERIYVLKTHYGKNIGALLYEKAMDIAVENSLNYVWLGVWEQNPRALRFYEKMGFVPFGTHIFDFNGDAQTDILMRKSVGSEN